MRPWPDPDYPEKGDMRFRVSPTTVALTATILAALVAALLLLFGR